MWHDAGLLDRELIIYKGLLSLGHRVTFVTYGDDSDYDFQDILGDISIIPVYDYIKKPKSKLLRLIKSFFVPFYIKKEINKTTILKTNQLWGSWVPVIIKILYKKPLLVRCGFEHYHQLILNQKPNKNIKYFFWKITVWLLSIISYRIAEKIIITSKNEKEFVTSAFKIDPDKIHVNYNVIDTNVFKPLEQKKYDNRIVFIGRLTNVKNLFSLLDAISQTKYKLDIIGNGELKSSINKYINENNINASILGVIPNADLPKRLSKYKLLVLPSFYEGNPKVLLEAMACSVLVLGSNITAISEIIKHNKNGILTQIDSNSIKKNIINAMEDKVLQKDAGKKARQFVVNNCSKDFIINKENIILQKMNKQQ